MAARLFQPSMAGGELSPSLYARTDISKYQVGLRKCRNFVLHRTGGVSHRCGFEFLGWAHPTPGATALIPFRFNTVSQVCLLEFASGAMRVWYQGALVLGAGNQPLVVPSPYTDAQAATMGYVQSGDVLYLAHPDVPPVRLSRYSWTDWRFETLTFALRLPPPRSARVTGISSANKVTEWRAYMVTAVSRSGEESIACGTGGYQVPAMDDWPVGARVWLAWDPPVTGSVDHYRVYKSENGIYGFIGMAMGGGFADSNIIPDPGNSLPTYENPFVGPGNYPAVVSMHQQRLVFAATRNQPNSLWMSRTGDFENFSRSTPPRDDDALFFTVASSEINPIRGLISLNDLIVMTSGSEIVCNGGSTGEALTPSKLSAKPQSYWGSGTLPPLVSGNTVLFVQDLGAAVRDLGYDYAVDGFTGNDRTILSRHLFDGKTIVSWAYAQIPESTFWMVRNDGVLLSLTYFREQDVGAWALHTTDGTFLRVAAIEGREGHDVYAVVRRTSQGTERLCIERMIPRRIEHMTEAVMLDSHLTYRGAPTTRLTGLWHLVGRTVGVVADGSVMPDCVVAQDGSIALPHPASQVVAGLRYDRDSRVETLDLDLGMVAGLGSVQGRRKVIPRVTVRVEKSREFLAGPDDTRLSLTKSGFSQYGSVPELFTGDIELGLQGGWTRSGRVTIRPNGPTPLTILAIMPDTEIGG